MGTRIHILPLAAALAAAAALVAPAAASAGGCGYSKPVEYPQVSPGRENATNFSKVISAEEAAKHGIPVSSTGGVSGENVRVDPRYLNIDAPVRVKMNVEVVPPDGTPPGKASDDFAVKVKTELEAGLKQAEAANSAGEPPGSRLQFEINAKVRGPEPSPGYHQIKLVNDASWRSISEINTGEGASSAVWSVNNANGHWTHEALHMMGLDDRYDDYFVPRKGKGGPVQLPKRGMSDAELATFLKGLKPPLKLSDGKCESKRPDGSDNDIMANSRGLNKGAGIVGKDRDFLHGRGADRLTVTAKAGDVLGNKDATAQNYGVGGNGEVTVSNPGAAGATASQDDGPPANGIVVYCIDLHRSPPSAGQVLDVMGPASQVPSSSMQALQRVLEVAARRQPAPGQTTPGGQAAVWRVTDNEPVGDNADAQAILAEAGVPADAQFEEYHFTTPNAGSPLTGSISPSGAPALRELPPKPPSFVKGATLQRKRVRVRRGRRAGVRLRVGLDVVGNDERVRAAIMPAGAKPQIPFETFEPRMVRAGRSTLKLSAPRLGPGRYTLVVSGLKGDRTVPFTVRRAPRRR